MKWRGKVPVVRRGCQGEWTIDQGRNCLIIIPRGDVRLFLVPTNFTVVDHQTVRGNIAYVGFCFITSRTHDFFLANEFRIPITRFGEDGYAEILNDVRTYTYDSPYIISINDIPFSLRSNFTNEETKHSHHRPPYRQLQKYKTPKSCYRITNHQLSTLQIKIIFAYTKCLQDYWSLSQSFYWRNLAPSHQDLHHLEAVLVRTE